MVHLFLLLGARLHRLPHDSLDAATMSPEVDNEVALTRAP